MPKETHQRLKSHLVSHKISYLHLQEHWIAPLKNSLASLASMSSVKRTTWMGAPAQGKLRNIKDVRGVGREIEMNVLGEWSEPFLKQLN